MSKGDFLWPFLEIPLKILMSDAPAEKLSFSWLIPLFAASFVIKRFRSVKRWLETDFGERPAWKYTNGLDTVSVVMWLLVIFSLVMFRFGLFFSGETPT